MIIQTFSYRTETKESNFQHTIHSVDIDSSIDKWLRKIEDLQDEVYSFDKSQVENIKLQFSNGQLKLQLNKHPYFLTYKVGDVFQVVNIDKVLKSEPDFIGKISYLTTEEGGRKGYAASGYRPNVRFEGRQEITSSEQLFLDKDKVFPGETVKAEIRMLSPDFFKNYLFVGQPFEIREGLKMVGRGEIIEIINPILIHAST